MDLVVTPRPKPPTKWRESPSLMVSERAKHWARRSGLLLEVVLLASGSVRATVVRVEQPEGSHRTLAECLWPVVVTDTRVVESTIAVAKQWCENEADRLAGAS